MSGCQGMSTDLEGPGASTIFRPSSLRGRGAGTGRLGAIDGAQLVLVLVLARSQWRSSESMGKMACAGDDNGDASKGIGSHSTVSGRS